MDIFKCLDSFVVHCLSFLPDKLYLSLRYRCRMGHWINWKNPKTFTEKIQWLKINNRRPEYTRMVDKFAVKEYVAGVIGEEYIIPTLGVWDKPEDIDWESLPDQFVLKTTHGGGGGGVVICRDKKTFDKGNALEKLTESLNSDIYNSFREWPYKDVPKRIIAEKYIATPKNMSPDGLPDYKFFCFNGEPRYCQVICEQQSTEPHYFYDMNWNHLEIVGLNSVEVNSISPVPRPKNLDVMRNICRELSRDIPYARVDLYVVDEREYFGELSSCPVSCFGISTVQEWNKRWSELLNIPTNPMGAYKCLIDGVINITKLDTQYDDLMDFKFFCFNGKVKFFKVDFGRFIEHHANYYSPNGEIQNFGESDYPPIENFSIILPQNLFDMVSLAEQLSKGHPFLRVDFYNVNGNIFFGELTFYPASGMGKFTPIGTDSVLGELIEFDSIS